MNSAFLLFEVLDKEPSLLSIWITFLMIGVIGFVVSNIRWQLVFITFLIPIIPIFFLLAEFHEPAIYQSIWAEEPSFLPLTYLAMILSFLLPIAGAFLNWKKSAIKNIT